MEDTGMLAHEGWGSLIWRVLRRSLLMTVIFAVITLMVAWVINWRTIYQIGQALLFAGLGSIAVGVFSVVGGWNIRTSYRYQYSRSASDMRVMERASQDLKDVFSSYDFMITMLIAGFLLIIAGSYLPLI
jgi:hypothetical protein